MQLHIPAWTACKLLAALALRRNDVTKLSAQLRLCDGLVQPYHLSLGGGDGVEKSMRQDEMKA